MSVSWKDGSRGLPIGSFGTSRLKLREVSCCRHKKVLATLEKSEETSKTCFCLESVANTIGPTTDRYVDRSLLFSSSQARSLSTTAVPQTSPRRRCDCDVGATARRDVCRPPAHTKRRGRGCVELAAEVTCSVSSVKHEETAAASSWLLK